MKGIALFFILGILVVVRASDREAIEKIMAMMKEQTAKSMFRENMAKSVGEEINPAEQEMLPGAPMEDPVEMPDVIPKAELFSDSAEVSASSESDSSSEMKESAEDRPQAAMIYHGVFTGIVAWEVFLA